MLVRPFLLSCMLECVRVPSGPYLRTALLHIFQLLYIYYLFFPFPSFTILATFATLFFAIFLPSSLRNFTFLYIVVIFMSSFLIFFFLLLVSIFENIQWNSVFHFCKPFFRTLLFNGFLFAGERARCLFYEMPGIQMRWNIRCWVGSSASKARISDYAERSESPTRKLHWCRMFEKSLDA